LIGKYFLILDSSKTLVKSMKKESGVVPRLSTNSKSVETSKFSKKAPK